MYRRFHRGFYAKKLLENTKQDSQTEQMACGHFIEKHDYFEQEKLNMIKEFSTDDIEEEIYVSMHRDELI